MKEDAEKKPICKLINRLLFGQPHRFIDEQIRASTQFSNPNSAARPIHLPSNLLSLCVLLIQTVTKHSLKLIITELHHAQCCVSI